jgi:hypothetical protein
MKTEKKRPNTVSLNIKVTHIINILAFPQSAAGKEREAFERHLKNLSYLSDVTRLKIFKYRPTNDGVHKNREYLFRGMSGRGK